DEPGSAGTQRRRDTGAPDALRADGGSCREKVTKPFDVAVIGGGIVGLATAYRLLSQRPSLSLLLLAQEADLASPQPPPHRCVRPPGLYYARGSGRGGLCREGKLGLGRFAAAHGIPWERRGRLVVAVHESERPRLEALRERAAANGVEVEEVGPEKIREIEP